MVSLSNSKIMAFSEQLLLNVNLNKRKSEKYPEWVINRLRQLKKDHSEIKFPKNIGSLIKIEKPIF